MSRIASREPAALRLTARLSRSDLLWVANTAHGPGGHWHARPRDGEPDHDHLGTGEAARRYLADHRVPVPEGIPDERTLGELGAVRAMVHRLTEPGADPWTEGGRVLRDATRYRMDAEGRLASIDAGWPGFVRDLLLPLSALVLDGTVLHRCANPACRLVFEDASRNHARRWCDAAACGNRDRVRRARAAGVVTPGLPIGTAALDQPRA